MNSPEYREECEGCRTSQDLSDPPGGIVRLAGGWVINQYRHPQAYLGWLAVQPSAHRDELSELTAVELACFGPHLKAIDTALRSYWRLTFPDDPVERVYFVYFFESPFDTPRPSPYHLHLHAIPRTRCIGALLREKEGSGTTINAWQIYRLRDKGPLPTDYVRPAGDAWPAADDLLRYLRNELERPR